jgi:hypothetical protein
MQENSRIVDLTGADASIWAWGHLWKRGSAHCAFDILDCIIREGDKISGWLFTATDGSVKSKAAFRWNDASVIERSVTEKKIVSAHEWVRRKWCALALRDDGLTLANKSSPAIVSFGRLVNPFYFISQSYSIESGDIAAKFITNRLCGDGVKGIGALVDGDHIAESEDLPTHIIRNKDKALNKIAESKIKELVHILESRSRHSIRNLMCVFLVEQERGSESKLWLHHVAAVTAEGRGLSGDETSQRSNTKIPGDRQSVLSSSIAPTTTSGHLRGGLMKCGGDFCGFIEDEEALLRETEEDALQVEAKKAIGRHRKLESHEVEGVDDGGVVGSPVNRIPQSEATQPRANPEMGVMLSSQAFKVPQKNIVLVRNDMLQLEESGADSSGEASDAVPWPPLVQHWWWRIGRSVVESKSKRIIVPQSSGHEIYNSIIGVASADPSSAKTTTQTAAKKPGRKLTAQNLGLVTGELNALAASEESSTRFNPLASKETNSKLGDLSWYYSDANVCERCYQVYREIDRRRKLQVREKSVDLVARSYDKKKESMFQSLPASAKESLQSVSLAERDKYLQQRQQAYYKRQKALTSRLAKAKRDEAGGGGGDSTFDVAGSEYSEFGADSSMHSAANSKYVSPNGAPKGSVGPAPWNLHDESVRSAYEDSIGSTFIRNIRSKAETIAMQVQEYRRRNDEEAMLGGPRAVDDNFKWSAVTGGASAPRDPSEISEIRKGMYKSHSAGEIKRRKPKEVIVTKQFDSKRLLHPWMRDMENERANRRMEDEVWKNDQELMDRYQSLQKTTIARKLPRKPKPGLLRPLPSAEAEDDPDEAVLSRAIDAVGQKKPPSSLVASYKQSSSSSSSVMKKGLPSPADKLSSPQPQVIPAMSSTVRFSNDSDLGLTRKNSLHTIEELDDEDTSPVKSKTPTSKLLANSNAAKESKFFEKPPLSVSRNSSTVESQKKPAPSSTRLLDDDDDDDDDDEGIGWSPFVVPKF